MRTSRAAHLLLVLAALLPLPAAIAQEGARSGTVQPRDEVPPIESDPEIVELRWFRTPLHYADVTAITRLLNGVLVRADWEVRAPGEVWISQLPRRPGDFPAGNVVDGGNLVVYGVRGDNSFLVRATEEDVVELQRLIRLLDVPFRQLRLRLSAGRLAAAGTVTNGGALHLADQAGSQRFDARIVPRVLGDGTIGLAIHGSLRVGGTTHPLELQLALPAGKPVQALTIGAGRRATPVWVEATLLGPDRPAATRARPRSSNRR